MGALGFLEGKDAGDRDFSGLHEVGLHLPHSP